MVMPASIARRKSSSSVPAPPCKVRGMPVAALICAIRSMSKCLLASPRTIVARSPCIFSTAGARTSTPAASANSRASYATG